MLQNLKLNLFHTSLQPNSPSKTRPAAPQSCNANKPGCGVSRRELAIFTKSSLLLLLSSQCVEPLNQSTARAEEVASSDTNVEDLPQQDVQGVDVESPAGEVSTVRASEDSQDATVIEDPAEEEVSADTKSETLAQDVPSDANVGNDRVEPEEASNVLDCGSKVATKRAFLDISIDGQPAGRVIIGLYGKDVPAGAARFSSLVSGSAGISYRRKEFLKILPNYVQHSGVRSYGVDAELASRTGSELAAETLMDEWERQYSNCPGVKNAAGTVSIIVRDPFKPPPKMKLVAKQGKLQIDQEEVGQDPNGTEFVITTKDSPELDASALVVGRVLEGMEVVARIGQVKTVQENTSSPYFRVAKLIGDKRAVVAERGFNRPYSKVIVSNCGLLQ